MRLSLDEFGNNGYTFETPKMAHKEFYISLLQICPLGNLLKYLKFSVFYKSSPTMYGENKRQK